MELTDIVAVLVAIALITFAAYRAPKVAAQKPPRIAETRASEPFWPDFDPAGLHLARPWGSDAAL